MEEVICCSRESFCFHLSVGLSAVLGDEVSNNPKRTQLAMISEIFNASVNYTYIKYLAVCVYIHLISRCV